MHKYTLVEIQHMAAIQTPLPASYYDAVEVEAAMGAVSDELMNLQPHIAQLDKASRSFIDSHVDVALKLIANPEASAPESGGGRSMSEQDKRAFNRWAKFPFLRGSVEADVFADWKAERESHAAALAQARREGDSAGYRRGVEALRDWLKCKDAGAGVASYNAWIEREAARLLSKGRTDG